MMIDQCGFNQLKTDLFNTYKLRVHEKSLINKLTVVAMILWNEITIDAK
jgi:hypothetical protein